MAIEKQDRGRGRRALMTLAVMGPVLASLVTAGVYRTLEERQRTPAVARDLTALFSASYGVLQGAEAAQRALSAALAARDTGVRFVPQYLEAARALRTDLDTVLRLSALVPECAAAARELSSTVAEAASAGDRVVGALRGRDRDGAVTAGYEFQASMSLARDAAQALLDAAHAAIPRRLGAVTGRAEVRWSRPLWAGGLGGGAVALVLLSAIGRQPAHDERAAAHDERAVVPSS